MREQPFSTADMPGWPPFAEEVPAGGTAYSNRSLARLLVLLTHDMEWGAGRPHLVRYEVPVRVGLSGPGSAQYADFLERYLALLAREAGIDIARGPEANLHVRFVAGPRFERSLPTASCVVAGGDVDFRDFVNSPSRYGGEAMARATSAEDLTIFIPQTAPPHLIRGCLLEEIAQALGPANDLYGIGSSIFNDDAAHIWPTQLDLLMLKVLYQPELSTGMRRTETEAAARAVLDRIHPEGLTAPDLEFREERALRQWRGVAQGVFGRRGARDRMRRAEEALSMARRIQPGGAAECHSLTTLGRVLLSRRDPTAVGMLAEARAVCGSLFGHDDIRIARLRLEEGTALFRDGRFDEAISLTDGLARRFAALGQEERLASLYALRSNAFHAIHRPGEAADARDLAARWGAYALGRDSEVLGHWLAH